MLQLFCVIFKLCVAKGLSLKCYGLDLIVVFNQILGVHKLLPRRTLPVYINFTSQGNS